jgi:hypothetical protein
MSAQDRGWSEIDNTHLSHFPKILFSKAAFVAKNTAN